MTTSHFSDASSRLSYDTTIALGALGALSIRLEIQAVLSPRGFEIRRVDLLRDGVARCGMDLEMLAEWAGLDLENHFEQEIGTLIGRK